MILLFVFVFAKESIDGQVYAMTGYELTLFILTIVFLLLMGLAFYGMNRFEVRSGLLMLAMSLFISLALSDSILLSISYRISNVMTAVLCLLVILISSKQAIRKREIEVSILKQKLNRLEQSFNITRSMMEITPELLLGDDLDKLMQRILEKAIELIPNAQSGSILIKEGDEMVFHAAIGYDLNVLKNIKLKFEDTFQYKIGNLYEPAVIEDIQTFNTKNLDPDRMTIQDVKDMSVAKAVLTCSITLDKKIYGFINLDNLDDEKAFVDADKQMIKHLASQIEIALKNHALVEEIYKMSQYDTLTGVNSRKQHEKLMGQMFAEAKGNKRQFCIAVIDVNDLKKVNDTYGHDVGDSYLIHFSEVVKSQLSLSAVFSRTGGDEFVIIMPETSYEKALDLIARIRQKFSIAPFSWNDLKMRVDFGCGIACYPTDGTEMNTLMRLSDKRMYEDKRMRKMIQ